MPPPDVVSHDQVAVGDCLCLVLLDIKVSVSGFICLIFKVFFLSISLAGEILILLQVQLVVTFQTQILDNTDVDS